MNSEIFDNNQFIDSTSVFDSNESNQFVHGPMQSLSQFISLFTDSVGSIVDKESEYHVSSLTFELPIQMSIGSDDDTAKIFMSSATQLTETSIMPIFHKVKITLEQLDITHE